MRAKQDIFFSYGHDANAEIVKRLKESLESTEPGHKVWIDMDAIRTGDDWRERITKGIANSDAMVAYLSSHSVRDPGVCLDELSIAIGNSSYRIITVLLEPEHQAQAPLAVSHIQYLDMSDWKNEKAKGEANFSSWYEEKVQQIIEAIKRENTISGEITKLIKILKPTLDSNSYHIRMGQLLRDDPIKRPWLMKRLNAWLNDPDGRRVYCMTGEPGIGKSVIAALVANEGTADVGQGVAGVHFCQRKSNFNDPKTVFTQLAFQMATRLPSYRSALLNATFNWGKASGLDVFQQAFIAVPARSIDGGMSTHFLIIDALDEAPKELCAILAEHRDNMPRWLRFFVTSRPEGILQDANLRLLEPELLDAQSVLNTLDVREYIERRLKSQTDLSDGKKQRFARILSEAAAGNFRYIALMLDNIVSKNIPFTAQEYLNGGNFPAGLSKLYGEHFTRVFKNTKNFDEEIRPILDILSVCVLPVPMQIMCSATDLSKKKILTGLAPLKSFIQNENEMLRLYHTSVQDWLLNAEISGPYAVEPDCGHTALAKVLLEEFDEACKTHKPTSSFGLHSLPDHVRVAAQKKSYLSNKSELDTAKLAKLGVTSEKLEIWAKALLKEPQMAHDSPWEDIKAHLSRLHICTDMMLLVLGETHKLTLECCDKLASGFHETGDLAAAWTTYRRLLKTQNKVLGPEASSTLTTRYNQTRCLYDRGDRVIALKSKEKLLEIMEKVEAAPYQYTLRLRSDLTYYTPCSGEQYVTSVKELKSILEGQEKYLGSGHADTQLTLQRLAKLSKRASMFAPGPVRMGAGIQQELDEFYSSEPEYAPPPDDYDTVDTEVDDGFEDYSYAQLPLQDAECWEEEHDFSAARSGYEEALKRHEEIRCNKTSKEQRISSEMLEIRFHLARCLYSLGKPATALAMLEKYLVTATQELGEDNRVTQLYQKNCCKYAQRR